MRAPAQHLTASHYAHAYVRDEDYVGGELLAGERIGRPLTRSRGKALLRSLILVMVVFGSGWMLLRDPATWWGRARWLGAQVMALTATVDRKTPPPLKRAASSAAAPPSEPVDIEPAKTAVLDRLPPTLPPPPPEDSVTPPSPPAKSMASPLTTASLPPAATDKQEPLPPPAVDRSDPYQVRAEAVGLHPSLSRVLLARLSEADYRNAGIAIKTALAKTPDDGTFVWPRKRRPGLALFKVHFVPGTSEDCRRYVVTVTKDGWATTAFPMERCSSHAGRLRRRAG